MPGVLVIEDELGLRVLTRRVLQSAGYQVCDVGTGTEGLRAALNESFDLVLLDLMLPDLPGEEVMRVLVAARPDAKIIILSSVTEIGRRVSVLEGGARDFVPKPFVNSELLARVRLRMRETAAPASDRLAVDESAYIEVQRRELVVGSARVPLSQREFTLLAHLAHRRGQVCTRQELLNDVWNIGFDPRTNVVDVYIGRLRAKLAPDRIETVRNVGYRLAAS